MKRLSSQKKGFTLIEIMVAVSIFVIVAFIVTSTLLAILDASRRANKIRLIVDNMNFALDSMTIKMKFGTDYIIGDNDSSIDFFDRDLSNICYKKVDEEIEGVTNGSIQKCVGGCGFSGDCISITTNEINVTKLKFQEGLCNNDICKNREIIVLVEAETKIKNKVSDALEFQTAVSQSLSQ